MLSFQATPVLGVLRVVQRKAEMLRADVIYGSAPGVFAGATLSVAWRTRSTLFHTCVVDASIIRLTKSSCLSFYLAASHDVTSRLIHLHIWYSPRSELLSPTYFLVGADIPELPYKAEKGRP